MSYFWNRRSVLGLLLGMAAFAFTPSILTQQALAFQPGSATKLGDKQLITPAELAGILQSAKQARPLILNVGPRLLYAQAHIPGAEYMGPGSDAQAIQQLRTRVKPLPRNAFIVLYCGCCPWNDCPNVFPAYKAISALGFTRVKVLYIADNFGTDWVYKGYPTIRGN